MLLPPMTMASLNGIVYRSSNQELVHLLLEEVAVKVLICDVSARVVLTQTYTNTSDTSTSRAKYVFPVPSRAAVCAFDLKHADGRVIAGISKEKMKAAEEHDKAIREGKFSGLLEWVTDDIFTISVGSIPAKQSVTTRLVYVLDLMDDEVADEVRFQLPVAIGQRYGAVPTSMENAASASSRTRLRITADIQMSGRLQNVKSPTHVISLSPYKTHLGRVSHRRTTAKFRSATFLEHDFVLVVRADGLDAPRCFVERDLRPEGLETIAMQLTIVPKFKLPPIPAQEFIFVVDRSGSMSGLRIETAKRTLNMLLRMLPGAFTTFNIFSFGSKADSLWPSSPGYTQDTLDYAINHVEGMSANYGGTEIRSALAFALGARNPHMPTVAFVLTDGEAHDVDLTISAVASAVAASTLDAPLRVFTLGIGANVSTAMCEGIARAGQGLCLLAVSSESIVGKCARLFRAGRSSILEDVSIDWGVPSESSSNGIIRFVPSVDPSRDQPPAVQIAPAPAVQQTPHHIANIDPGMRFVVFMISTHKILPKHITVRGRLDGTSTPFTHTVRVEHVKSFSDDKPDIPLVHILAARRLITDFEENQALLPAASPSASVEDICKAVIVRLGEEYQLATRHTSFVAVDADAPPARGLNDSQGRSLRLRTRHNQQHDTEGQTSSSWVEFTTGSLSTVWTYMSSTVGAAINLFQGGPTRGRSARHVPAEFPGSRPTPPSSVASRAGQTSDSFSTLSSLNGSFLTWTPSRTPSPSPSPPAEADHARSPSPPLQSLHNAAPEVQRQHGFNPQSIGLSATASASPPVTPRVFDLIQLQAFDGSYPLNHSFGEIVGHDILGRAAEFQADEKAWATALAVAYLKKHLSNQPDLLECLLDKAMEFARGNSHFDSLVRQASVLI